MSRWISRSCFYLQRCSYRARIRPENDNVAKLLNQKIEATKTISTEKILRNARGTKDFHPEQMKIREEVFRTIVDCFKQHGANTIDTPVIENLNLFKEKYGEESKLIYQLKNSPDDDEDLALRYDLTVPFARYLVQNRLSTMKRYHIGKVYRLDDPKMNRARYREFYQCDLDIAGEFDSMISDAECLKIVVEILDRLSLGKYRILINHRKLLDAIFTICGVQPEMFRSLSSSVDKLDKNSWEIVRNEMINEKGLTEEQADRIWSFVQRSGGRDLIDELRRDEHFLREPLANEALNELDLLFRYLSFFNILDKVIFDLKLARGLDYYTGMIFEAVLKDNSFVVGSVAAGGRYDQLVEKLHSKQRRVPCVGLSIGVERIFAIKENQRDRTTKIKTTETEIFVASAEKNFLEQRMKLCDELWRNGFKAEMPLKLNPRLLDQFQYCEKNQIDLCLIIGSSELENQTLKLRHIKTREEFTISREDFLEQIRIHLDKLRRN